MASQFKVVLFEDDPQIGPEVEKAIRRNLPRELSLLRFPLDAGPKSKGPYEDCITQVLRAALFANTVLLVTDRDLSASNWPGLSEAAVTRVGQKLGYPVAWYAQRAAPEYEIMTRIPGDGRIGLPNTVVELAREAAVIAKGFVDLQNRLTRHHGQARRGQRPRSPGELLAALLGEPAAASHLDAYACGDQLVVAEILKRGSASTDGGASSDHRRLVAALGVWIVDVVLRYPGVLLGEIAAASYLDIDPPEFARPEIRNVFRSALWSGAPFVDSEKPRWWKIRLDDLLAKNGVELGAELVAKRRKRQPRFCPCHVDPTLHAGYFCMVTKKPVSAENSVGPITWFPPGAELARITRNIFDKVAPWVGR